MNKKEMMSEFIDQIYNNGLLTLFIKNIFDYENFYDYNYIYRKITEKDRIIIDIYDNISDNRFNRYVFIFKKGEYDINVVEEGNVYVTYIHVLSVFNSDNKLLKLAYLFTLRKNKMVEYAEKFLDKRIVNLLDMVINSEKNIHV